MSRRRERGVALLAAVIALATLTVLATGFSYTGAVDQQLARNALAVVQADALVRSGVAAAAVVLQESRATAPTDTLTSPWAQDSGRQALGAGWVAVRIEDEARRLDLNAPDLADALPRLLAALHLDPRLADAIADWTDPDDAPRAAGAERAWYLGLVPPYVPANEPLRSVGELRLVRGVDAGVLERLRPYVSVAGEGAVNPNTASREVLLAVAGDAAVVDRVLAARARRPIVAEEFASLLPGVPPERLTDRGASYLVRAVAGVGDMQRAVEATLSAPGESEPAVVAWRPTPTSDPERRDASSRTPRPR